ncbi:MAG: alpha/beta hydrolase [Oscillospiraceae bacterium]|nr:alpha/beta hydrolase [Oscillospiraceae bacterium]
MAIQWIKEANYSLDMLDQAEPYLAVRRIIGTDERISGQKIYYEHFEADHPKGVIVISHGFTESVQKFSESIYYMLQAGYSVWGIDHRGHGKSHRHNENPYVVHVEHFEDYVLDLRHLTETVIKPVSGLLPLYLYCHSMGGCVGAWTIEQYPHLFRKAVLSSPMLGLTFAVPTPIMFAAASLMGIGERKKNPLKPVNSFDDEPDFEHSCDSSECRYLYYFGKRMKDPTLQTFEPSIGWGLESVKACYRVTSKKETARIAIPVLLFQAGADTVVKNASQNLFASRVHGCELVEIPGMKHELYMTDSEVLIPYWEKVFAFFD